MNDSKLTESVDMNIKTIEFLPGASIHAAIFDAIAIAEAESIEVRFEFNSASIRVMPGSAPELLLRDFRRAMDGYHQDPIGPYPPSELSAEQKESDARIQAENAKRVAEQTAAALRETAAKKSRLDAEIDGVEMDLSAPEAWEQARAANNTDCYGAAVITYAERWARLMQSRMQRFHAPLEAVAESASRAADIDGITGFMYSAAVSILAQAWKHGEALRRWHNCKTQIRDEGERANESGGTLNPALLCISESEPS